MVSIKSEAVNQFIWTRIVEPTATIWLGATNEVGTKNFKWLEDGSDVTDHYSNWWSSRPSEDTNNLNAIAMYSDDGTWFDLSVSETRYVVCERDKVLFDQSNATMQQLDSQLETVIKSVQEMKQSNIQLLKTQSDLNEKLTRLLELNAINGKLATDQQNTINSLEQSLVNITQSVGQNDLAINTIHTVQLF